MEKEDKILNRVKMWFVIIYATVVPLFIIFIYEWSSREEAGNQPYFNLNGGLGYDKDHFSLKVATDKNLNEGLKINFDSTGFIENLQVNKGTVNYTLSYGYAGNLKTASATDVSEGSHSYSESKDIYFSDFLNMDSAHVGKGLLSSHISNIFYPINHPVYDMVSISLIGNNIYDVVLINEKMQDSLLFKNTQPAKVLDSLALAEDKQYHSETQIKTLLLLLHLLTN